MKENYYSPKVQGVIIAVRIYEVNNNVMAALRFSVSKKVKVINWTSVKERELYREGFNGYTLFYDERPKRPFAEN